MSAESRVFPALSRAEAEVLAIPSTNNPTSVYASAMAKCRATLSVTPDELVDRMAKAFADDRYPGAWDVSGDKFKDYYRRGIRASLAELSA